jgi:hypothetical protein
MHFSFGRVSIVDDLMFPLCFQFGKCLILQDLLAAVRDGECQMRDRLQAVRGTLHREPGSLPQTGSAGVWNGEFAMKTLTLATIAGVAALLAACNQSPAEQKADQTEAMGEAQADAVREDGEQRADALENQADTVDTQVVGQPPAADALENRAEAVRDNTEQAADRVEDAAAKSADVQRQQD